MIEGLAKPWGELALYNRYATYLWESKLPYVDFFLEYPPLSLPFFWIAQVFGEKWFTLTWYGLIGLFVLATFLMIKKMGGRGFAFIASILPLAGLFWDRFDMIPAFFSLWAVILLKKEKYSQSWFFLGLAILVKIYPVVLLPYFLVKTPLKSILRCLLPLTIPILLLLGIISLYGGLEGLKGFAKFQGVRGVHLESVRAIPYLLDKENSVTEFRHNTFEIGEK